MIDTDKYEGHTEGPWTAEYGDYTTHVTNCDGVVVASVGFELDKDGQLIADAPLILQAYKEKCEEVKRLREENQRLLDYLVQVADEYTDADGITYEIYCKFGDEDE